jgi:hypothetical protein
MTWGESAGVRFIGTGQDGSPEESGFRPAPYRGLRRQQPSDSGWVPGRVYASQMVSNSYNAVKNIIGTYC